MRWNSPGIRHLLKVALNEDAARQDITTRTLIPRPLKIEAQIRAKQNGILCGLPVAAACFRLLDPKTEFKVHVREGGEVKAGALLATVRAKARAILSGERTALNAVQHLSGVATFTSQQVKRLGKGSALIYDTRKTLPGWRELQKYAVRCGGGKNHRMSLKDSVLIKDNHLMLCRLIEGDWLAKMAHLRRKRPGLTIQLEIQTDQDLQDAFRLKPDQVLLDNMPPAKLRQVIKRLRSHLPGLEIEISGGIRTHELSTLKTLGVERISMGRLTHSAPAFDCSLDITHVFNSH